MAGETRFPDVIVPDRPARPPRTERSRPEAPTSLGIGGLASSASAGAAVDAFTQLLARGSMADDGIGARPVDDRPGRVLAIEPCGPSVRILRIARPAGFTFEPGQYVKLGVPGGRREDFSLASAPHEPHLELAIELREGGRVTPALFSLRVGDVVEVSDTAKGKLLLDPSAPHHLMVATVTGIAPLISIVRDALHRGTTADFTVVLGASYQAELPFHAELEALADASPRLTYRPTVSRPDEPANHTWTGAKGRADVVARQLADGFDPATTHVYAVGNKGMIQSVTQSLGGAGFAISTESYGG